MNARPSAKLEVQGGALARPGSSVGRLVPRALIAMALHAAPLRAAPPPADDALFRVREGGRMAVDGGLILALPVALGTGLSTGAGAGVSIGGGHFALGVRASWSTATESSLDWTVTQDDFELRLTAAAQQRAGRGLFALRLGLGPTLVHEVRLRNQAARANLTGLDRSIFRALPSVDLAGVVSVHVAGPWLLMLAAGPSLSIVDGGARWGWTSLLGAGWQP